MLLTVVLLCTACALNVTQGSLNGYFTYQEALTVLDNLAATHPSVVSPKRSIGTTWEERDLWAADISKPGLPLSSRGTLLVMAAHHARELISVSFVLWAVDHLLGLNSTMSDFLLRTRKIV